MLLFHNCLDSFAVFLKNPQRQFPRQGLLFHLPAWTNIVPPSPEWKGKAPDDPGRSLWQAAPKRRDTGQQALEVIWRKRSPVGRHQAFLDPRVGLELAKQPYSSVREGRKYEGGGKRRAATTALLPGWCPQGKPLPGFNRRGVGVWSSPRLGTPAHSKESFYE